MNYLSAVKARHEFISVEEPAACSKFCFMIRLSPGITSFLTANRPKRFLHMKKFNTANINP